MKKIYPALLSLLILAVPVFSQDVPTKLNALLDAYANQNGFNGTALVAHHGKILLNKGYGYQNVKDSTRNDQHTIFQLGSLTKQFTATLILKLQEERKLNIQDKISKYFPDYPKADSITIENLLTHTSGIFNYTNNAAFMANEVTKPTSREKIFALFKDKPLEFTPGTKFSYSNSGYMLLGYIIADVTKMPYEQAMRKYIFRPLGMSHSGFDFTGLVSKEKATGYFNLTDEGNTPAAAVDSSVSFAAGAIYSTTGDLYKWHHALRQNSIITAASLDKAHTPFKNNYGYGWNIDTVDGKKMIAHGGGIHGFNTHMVNVLKDDVCIVLLSNVANPRLEIITKNIIAILYDKPYEVPKQRTAITLPVATLEQYTGVYELAPDFRITFKVKDGQLTGQPTNQSVAKLYAEKVDLFFLKVVDAQVGFTRDSTQTVNGMILYQNGRERKGRKLPAE